MTDELPGSVLFACSHNAIRSPMAESILKYLHGHRIYVGQGIYAEVTLIYRDIAGLYDYPEMERRIIRKLQAIDRLYDDFLEYFRLERTAKLSRDVDTLRFKGRITD